MKKHWLTGSAWNLVGIGVPFVIAVASMPLLLRGLGAERYGLLILAWAVVGYFSIFDFGLSRAITQLVAQAYRVSPADSAPVVATGAVVLGLFGAIGGGVLFAVAGLVGGADSIPEALRAETVRSIRVLGVGLPFVVVSTGLRGALEGVFDFGWVNIIRMVSGIGTYVVPLAVLTVSVQLDWICLGLVVLRVVSCAAYYWRCRIHFMLGGLAKVLDRAVARRLLGYGGWVTVSNLVSPLMAYMDRFLVAGAISVALAGYYATSQEIVTRFQIIPTAVLAVLFPAISRSHTTSPEHAGDIFFRGTQYVMFALLPLAAACLLFAREGLGLWFGAEFATAAFVVAQILTIGSFVNCLALNPHAFLQAIGRPDITAKIHLLELPLYLLLLWAFMVRFGVIGVALAWSIRMALDLAILLYAAASQSLAMSRTVRRAAARMVMPVVGLSLLLLIDSLAIKSIALVAVALVSAWALWLEWKSGELMLMETQVGTR